MDRQLTLSHMAQQMVVGFASSSVGGCADAERLARSLGSTSLRIGVLASSQLLIVAEDTKRFYHPDSTLAGETLRTQTPICAVRLSDGYAVHLTLFWFGKKSFAPCISAILVVLLMVIECRHGLMALLLLAAHPHGMMLRSPTRSAPAAR